MKSKPTLFSEIMLALALTAAAAVAGLALSIFALGSMGVKMALAVVVIFYGLRVLSGQEVRAGRLIVGGLSIAVLVIGLLLFTVIEFAIAAAGIFWLLRWVAYYRGILPVVFDAGLAFVSIAAATSAAIYSQSIIIGLWCFLLLQALHALIPASITCKSGNCGKGVKSKVETDSFAEAHRTAEAALQALYS